ncbi:MAG TPA: response regulator transcription factor [Caulobacteraceae bacterium]|nr:response regulator transcription factor [Caulobacteraceae bacterium]
MAAARPPRRILVVDADAAASAMLSAHLTGHGYRVEAARDAAEMQSMLDRAAFDLIVLDAMLRGEGGLSICRRLCRPGGPALILLSALCDETERIVGLEVGADDYLSKACSPRELLARVRAVLRRCDKPARAPACDVRLLGWQFDASQRQVRSPSGLDVILTAAEYALLQVFVDRPLKVLSRRQLRDLVGGNDNSRVCLRTVGVRISRLRHKLGACGGRNLIRTRRNEGYTFDARSGPTGEGRASPEPPGSARRACVRILQSA